MSEENKVQLTTFVNGDNITIRTANGEDLAETLEGLAEFGDRAVTALGNFKQLAIAKGVFTGDANTKKASSNGSGKRASDTPPPSTDDGGVPTCEHGPMKDLRSSNYKYDYYCTLETKNWKDKCRPVKL